MSAIMENPASQTNRFTLDGSDELERHLTQVCKNVLAGLRQIIPPHNFEALMLGGGYGRGEGGVLETSSGHRPYNDLEFYVFIRGNRWLNERRYAAKLNHLGHQLAAQAGIEVEFKITSLTHLQRSSPSMFYYDLYMGNKWLWGDRSRLEDCAKHGEAANIPLAEATRLLMNRGTGLLFAREKLFREPFRPSDADFIGRNLAKAQLAFGDAVLAALGQYHWSCRERDERLGNLKLKDNPAWLREVQRLHEEGVEFKLRPHETVSCQTTLQRRYEELSALGREIWLWLESQRLGRRFATVRDYALSPVNKCPETNAVRNFLVNAKTFGSNSKWLPKALRYPRERLLNALAVLLWEDSLDDTMTKHLQTELQTRAASRKDLVKAYQILSARLNGSTLQPL